MVQHQHQLVGTVAVVGRRLDRQLDELLDLVLVGQVTGAPTPITSPKSAQNFFGDDRPRPTGARSQYSKRIPSIGWASAAVRKRLDLPESTAP